jgi:hypothetical protein
LLAGSGRRAAFLPLARPAVAAHADAVLRVHCPRHRSEVLLPESRIRALHNTDHGIVVVVECFDGERIVLRTGRGPRRSAEVRPGR